MYDFLRKDFTLNKIIDFCSMLHFVFSMLQYVFHLSNCNWVINNEINEVMTWEALKKETLILLYLKITIFNLISYKMFIA